jgi:hypothetical protein
VKARTCPSCGRTWSDRGAVWCAGCGSSLPQAQPGRRATSNDGGGHREVGGLAPTAATVRHRRGATVLALAAVVASILLLAVLTDGPASNEPTEPPNATGSPGTGSGVPPAPGGGTVELGAPAPRSEGTGTWSPGTEAGSAAVVPAGTAFPPSEPTCDTEGCAVWRSTVLDQRPLLVNERLAVHLGLELLIGVDIDTGRWRWSRGHSDPRGVSPAAALTASHLDERTLAIAYGHRLRIHAAETGRILGEVDLAPIQVTDIRRHDGQLVVSGRARDRNDSGTRIVGLDDAGSVRFELEVTLPIRGRSPHGETTAPLLAISSGDLVRFDATTGVERWRRALDGRQVDGTTLLDRDTGEVTVLSTRDGRELLRLDRPGAVAAGVRGGVLIVTFADRIELHDRDGTALGEVAVAPERTVVDTTGRQVVVAVLPAGDASDPEPRIRIGRRTGGSGGLVALPSIADATTVPLPPGREPDRVRSMRRADGVLIAGPDAGWAWVVDTRDATATRLDLPLLPQSEIGHGDGLTIVRNGQRLTVLGAGGSFGVRGVTQVAALDPLVIHGGSGTLRLDRTLVDGRPDGED